MTRPTTRLLLAAALALVVAAGGCGGSGSDDATTAPAATQPGSGRPVVTLGTRTATEQIVLGQLYKQALEARGFRVRLKQNIGSTAIADAALRSGEIDVYPESAGVFERSVAHDRTRHADADALLAAARSYGASHGFTLLAATPFENGDAIAVTPSFAEAHRLRTIGDLRGVPGLRLGARPELRRAATGLPGIARVYGLDDVVYAPLTDGLQYPALDDDRIDAAIVRTTDGELAQGDYVLLGDPLDLFGFERVVPIVATRVLDAEGPAFAHALDAVSARLTARAVQELNAATALDHESPDDVARDFLEQQRLA